MGDAKKAVGLLVLCLVMVSMGCAYAQDWPQWRGPDRDGKVTGFVPPDEPPAALDKVWSAEVGSSDSTPALVDDKLYVFTRQGDEEVILCLNASDGSQVWENRYAAAAVTGPAARHPGPRSSPAVAEGKVVTLGVAGVVSCLDAATGELAWRKDPFPNVVPRFFTSCSPLIADGMAIAHLGGQGNGALMGFELATGDAKWQWTDEAAEYGSPVLMSMDGTESVVTLSEKSVVGVSLADGSLLWRIPFVPEGRSYNAGTPIIDGDKVIYSGSKRGTHAARIEKQGDGFAPVEVWSTSEVATQFNTPVLANGLLFGLSDQGKLFCLNAATGETAWVAPDQLGRGGFGAIVDLGEVIVALPMTGELIAFQHSAAGYAELARMKVADTPTYAHPVIAGNRILIKDEGSLTLWTLP